MNNPTSHLTNNQSIVNVYSLLQLFTLFSYSKIESLNDVISALKSNLGEADFACSFDLDMKVASTLKDTISSTARIPLEINMSPNNLVFHNNPQELAVCKNTNF